LRTPVNSHIGFRRWSKRGAGRAQKLFGSGADGAKVVVAGLRFGEERFEVLAHGAVQDRRGGTAGTVDGGRAGCGTGADLGGGGG
jgi:hypothetical protein